MPFPVYYTDGKVGIGLPNPEVELDVLGDLAVSGTISSGGAPLSAVTLGPVGSTPNADAASIADSVLTLQPADGTHPGVITSGAQTIGGAKTFSSTVAASNISGTNSGDVTLAAVGAVPSANGASLSAQVLTLQPADATHPGLVTTGVQTLAGVKTFSSQPVSANGYNVAGASALESSGGITILRSGDNSGNFQFVAQFGTEVGRLNARGFGTNLFYTMAYTDSSGTPGNATINKGSGRSAIASGASACVITNAFCMAASVVMVTAEDLDATLLTFKCVPTDGSFTVTGVANATANWKFRWALFNSIG